jgi:hypothetical protein
LHAGSEHQLRPVVYTSCVAAGAVATKMARRWIFFSPDAYAEWEEALTAGSNVSPTVLRGENRSSMAARFFLRRCPTTRRTAGDWTF